MAINTIIFDLGGVLIDWNPEYVYRQVIPDVEKRRYFLDVRRKFGLPKVDEDEFAYEFRLQTIQRCLKAAGTFSFQSAMREKTYFIQFIKPMLRISVRGAISLSRFPAIQEILGREME